MSDPEGFSELYEQHVALVYGFFGYRVGSREQAEDLTQVTFERALAAWDRYDPQRGTWRAWLLAIARNLLVDHYRREGIIREEPFDHTELSEHSAETVSIDLSAELITAVSHLDDRDRELIALRYGGDLTGPEIAEITGLTLANVQQILSRALRAIRDELEYGRDSAGAAG